MNTFKSIYCRFCAEQKPEDIILDLTLDGNLFDQIVEKLSNINFNYVDLSSENQLPKTICLSCYESLTNSYDFLSKTKEAQCYLNSLVVKKSDIKLETRLNSKPRNKERQLSIKLESDSEQNKPNQAQIASDTESFRLDQCLDDSISFESQDETHPDHGAPDCSWSGYPWACVHCNAIFRDIKLLREHAKQVHGLCYAFKCADCDDEEMFNFEDFVEHVRVHRDYLGIYCQYCNMKLESYEHTKLHTNKHIDNQNICSMCGALFHSNQLRRQHRAKYKPKCKKLKLKKKVETLKVYECVSEDMSWTGYSWICQCGEKFPDVHALRSHTKDAHGQCFAMRCMDCLENVDSFKGLVDHVRRHRPYLKQYCQYCNYKYEAEDEANHIYLHFSGDQKICEGCGQILADRFELNSHIATYNPPTPKRIPFKKRDRPITVDDLTCPICNKVTKSLSNLKSHKLLHTERNRNFTCDQCGKAFYTNGALSAHKILHENPDPEICKICKKSFLTISRLKKHVKTHTGEKPFQCQACKRSFRLKEQLRYHSITHTNEMPFQCEFCSKAFRFKNVLKTHVNQHTGARPYQCSQCAMDFANWSNCNKHMKRKHGMTLAKNILTSFGKLPLNPTTGLPKPINNGSMVREWTEEIMGPRKRGKKTDAAGTSA